MDSILTEGLGDDKLFDYISVNRSGDVDGRPTTECQMQVPPLLLCSGFPDLLSYHGANNNYTPGHIRVDVADDPFLNGSVGSSSPVSVTITDSWVVLRNINSNIFGDENDVFEIEVTAL